MEKITVEVSVNLPCKEIWKFFNEPKHIKAWGRASEDWHTPRATNNLSVGGKFNYRMESLDGKNGFDFIGTYSEIIPYELINYTIEGDRKVHIDFIEKNGVTHIIETFDAEDENSLEMQRSGWQSILNNFKKYAENH